MHPRELPAQELALVDAAALLHDVGRFLHNIGSIGRFWDLLSVDHADLGAKTLDEEGVWQWLPPEAAAVLRQAVVWHNKRGSSRQKPPAAWLPAQVVRGCGQAGYFRHAYNRQRISHAAYGRNFPSRRRVRGNCRYGGCREAGLAGAGEKQRRISRPFIWVYDLNTVEAVRYVDRAGFLSVARGRRRRAVASGLQAVEACAEAAVGNRGIGGWRREKAGGFGWKQRWTLRRKKLPGR